MEENQTKSIILFNDKKQPFSSSFIKQFLILDKNVLNMKILALSGSTNQNSSNHQLLVAIQEALSGQHEMTIVKDLHEFEFFTIPNVIKGPSDKIKTFKEQVINSDAVIVATPEYSHNIPAVLKNIFEWCYDSGEFNNKPTLAIVMMPNEPRGKDGMDCLVKTLKGQKAKVVATMPLFFSDIEKGEDKITLPEDIKEMIVSVVETM